MEAEKAREKINEELLKKRSFLEISLKLVELVKQREEEMYERTMIQIELCRGVVSPVTAIIKPILEIIKRFVIVPQWGKNKVFYLIQCVFVFKHD